MVMGEAIENLYNAPPSQRDQVLRLFAEHGNVLTLGQIMRTTLAAEYRARFTELRREGYVIACELKRPASQNLYTLTPPVKFEESGQGMLL